jgi:hypothetical protein
MKRHELLDKYTALTKRERLVFLARLASELTVCARDTYVPGTDQVAKPGHLRSFNELQHRVMGHLRDLLSGNRDRYPDEVICGMIFEGVKELNAETALRRLLQEPSHENQRRRSRAVVARR